MHPAQGIIRMKECKNFYSAYFFTLTLYETQMVQNAHN
jgi:hypothetical protein